MIINFFPIEWKPLITAYPTCLAPFSNKQDKKVILKITAADFGTREYKVEIIPSTSKNDQDFPQVIKSTMKENEVSSLPEVPCPSK